MSTTMTTEFPLREWFLSDNYERKDNVPLSLRPQSSRGCLILDGGISTHLLETGNFDLPVIDDENDNNEYLRRLRKHFWSSSLLLCSKCNAFGDCKQSDDCNEGDRVTCCDYRGQAAILQGHVDWLSAGANVIETVTYQCHFEQDLWPVVGATTIMTHNTMKKMYETAIDLANQARRRYLSTQQIQLDEEHQDSNKNTQNQQQTYIALSWGCYGSALADGSEYSGKYNNDCTTATLVEFYKRKWEAIYASAYNNIDIIAIETVPNYLECQAIVEFVNQLPDSAPPCYISLSCQVIRKEDSNCVDNAEQCQLRDGTELSKVWECLRKSHGNNVVAWGFNCGRSGDLVALVKHLWRYMISHNDQPRGLVLYPNLGGTWHSDSYTWSGLEEVSTHFASDLYKIAILQLELTWKNTCLEFLKNPQQTLPKMPHILLGGCCRTTPFMIHELKQLLINSSNYNA